MHALRLSVTIMVYFVVSFTMAKIIIKVQTNEEEGKSNLFSGPNIKSIAFIEVQCLQTLSLGFVQNSSRMS